MIQTSLILLTALVFSIAVTPIARRIALKVGIVSVPRSRDIHIAPVPMLGGAAIYAAFVAAFIFLENGTFIREGVGILLGATLVAFVGLVDDRWRLPPLIKFGGQVLAVALLIIGGTTVQLFKLPWMNWIITVIWIVGITNALNFLDNMNGLAAGLATVASAFFLLLATMNEPRQVLVGAMAAALMGSCIGFLRYNFSSSASIFMGDTGSLFVGFILAVLAVKLRFLSNIPVVTWMVPVCVLGLLVFDTTLVVVARLRRGVNPFTTAGKDHVSHRLVALGMTRLEAVLTCYLVGGAGGMVGTYMTRARLEEAYMVAGVLLLALVAGVAWLEYHCPSGVIRNRESEKR